MMIRLKRYPKPDYLSDEKVAQLTQDFIDNKTNVWNHNSIKDPLLNSSFKKCAYCECNINEESKYMEVEHFEDKDNNPNKVVQWDNLLPSCKRCNGSKGTHDVISEPIINPYVEDPKEHLYFKLYRFHKKSDKGEKSIEVTDLNNSERLVYKRFEIGNKLQETLSEAKEKKELYLGDKTTRRKNQFVNIVRGILNECQPSSIYSATTATILHSDENLDDIIRTLQTENLWDDDFENLYRSSSAIKLDIFN